MSRPRRKDVGRVLGLRMKTHRSWGQPCLALGSAPGVRTWASYLIHGSLSFLTWPQYTLWQDVVRRVVIECATGWARAVNENYRVRNAGVGF